MSETTLNGLMFYGPLAISVLFFFYSAYSIYESKEKMKQEKMEIAQKFLIYIFIYKEGNQEITDLDFHNKLRTFLCEIPIAEAMEELIKKGYAKRVEDGYRYLANK